MERNLTGVNKVTILEKKVEELKTELAKYQVMLTEEHKLCFSSVSLLICRRVVGLS